VMQASPVRYKLAESLVLLFAGIGALSNRNRDSLL
jgi:hypothetical protein